MIKIGFISGMQRWSAYENLAVVIYHIDRLKGKNTIISIESEKHLIESSAPIFD